MTSRRAHEALHPLAYDCPNRSTMREQRWLRVMSRGQYFGRALEHHLSERQSQRCIDFLERAFCFGKRTRQVARHAGLLRSLSGEKQDDIHKKQLLAISCWLLANAIGDVVANGQRPIAAVQNRITIDAHVKPAPNATHSTVVPSLMRPSSMASSIAIGIEADEVLP